MKKTFLLRYSLISLIAFGCAKNKAPDSALPSSTSTSQKAPKDAPKPAESTVAENTVAKTPTQALDDAIKIALETVYFDFDSYVLTAAAQENLRHLSAALKQNKGVRLQIEGHCDRRGSPEYNIALSEKRANSIKEFLVSQGTLADSLETSGKGKEEPKFDGDTEEIWAKNRRGELKRIGG